MNTIFEGVKHAFSLIFSFNKDLYEIIGLSLYVTILSTLISAAAGMPLGVLAGSRSFKGKKLLMRFVNTFMGIPPVVAGLIVYLVITRKGPLGGMQMIFTPGAMIIAQVLIVTPIITGLSASAVRLKSASIIQTCRGLGLGKFRTMMLMVYECRYPLMSALAAGYGRAVAEVGAVSIVGGNIAHKTRVMTTAIMLETNMGNYDIAIGIGIVLLTISFFVNWFMQRLQEDEK